MYIDWWDSMSLNTTVAKFLGWMLGVSRYGGDGWRDPNGCVRPKPDFVGNTDAALLVVEKLRDDGYVVEMRAIHDDYVVSIRRIDWSVITYDITVIEATAPTLALAICVVVEKLHGHSDGWWIEEKIEEYRKAKAAGTKYAAVFAYGDDRFVFKDLYVGHTPAEAM